MSSLEIIHNCLINDGPTLRYRIIENWLLKKNEVGEEGFSFKLLKEPPSLIRQELRLETRQKLKIFCFNEKFIDSLNEFKVKHKSEKAEMICSICFQYYEEEDFVLEPECSHKGHSKCLINKWKDNPQCIHKCAWENGVQ